MSVANEQKIILNPQSLFRIGGLHDFRVDFSSCKEAKSPRTLVVRKVFSTQQGGKYAGKQANRRF
jgi:hypothetical protein